MMPETLTSVVCQANPSLIQLLFWGY